jgi:predicted transcriptional regulator/Zn-dependent protease
MVAMRSWSISLGRLFGIPVRLHGFFFLLLGLMVSHAVLNGLSALRGIALWMIVLAVLGIRELARVLTAAWHGLTIRSILVLPLGGELTLDQPMQSLPTATQRNLALAGPIASLLTAALLYVLARGWVPSLVLTTAPYVDASHLLRALLWANVLIGLVNLLPAEPLDGAWLAHGQTSAASRLLDARLARVVGFGLITLGVLFGNLWVMSMGLFVLFGPQAEPGALRAGIGGESDTTKLRDVMLTVYATVSGADTLEGALERSAHALQDVFPVVRGRSIVGAIARQRIVDRLIMDGNGFVQGVMSKAAPGIDADAPLAETLRNLVTVEGAQLLPVTEDGKVIGIVTPQHLAQALRTLEQRRRLIGLRSTE